VPAGIVAHILAVGANQIATVLNVS